MSETGLNEVDEDPTPLVTEIPYPFQQSFPVDDEPVGPMIRSVPQAALSPEEDDEEDPPLIDVPRFCPGCGMQVAGHDQFCEGCGLPLMPVDEPPAPQASPSTAITQRLPTTGESMAAHCEDCGGAIGPDGYCETCGTRARPARDHLEDSAAGWLAGVCDRGVRHERNEDALALGIDPLDRGIIVICDGVSTSDGSDVGSLAGARAARDLLVAEPTAGQGTAESRSKAVAASLVDATIAANAAVVNSTSEDSGNAASCTIVAAVVSPGEVHYAHLGDSRLYWFGDDGDLRILTADDSVAQARIALGVAREEAETGPNAHAITRWLGRDSEDIIPHTGTLQLTAGGWVLGCSDGLWNYASDPPALWAQFVAARGAEGDDADPLEVCKTLVAWANQQGGRDNITVALARVSALTESAPNEE